MISLPSIVIVTAPTRIQGLVARWGTKGQAKFRMKQAIVQRLTHSKEHSNQATIAEADFDQYEVESLTYTKNVERLRESLNFGLPTTIVERKYLPQYEFRNAAVVVVIGPDGLVANTAKYVGDLPIIGVNPDSSRNDGVLLPFSVSEAPLAVESVLENKPKIQPVTMAEARLNDGQRLLAFNDIFIGRRSHASARYNLNWKGNGETQSSSGVLVSTGAGATGWLSSVFNMMHGVNRWTGGNAGSPVPIQRDERKLAWVVREPFISRHSSSEWTAGTIENDGDLDLESLMPEGGAIFSDGIEDDFLEFNSGTTVQIRIAEKQAIMVVK